MKNITKIVLLFALTLALQACKSDSASANDTAKAEKQKESLTASSQESKSVSTDIGHETEPILETSKNSDLEQAPVASSSESLPEEKVTRPTKEESKNNPQSKTEATTTAEVKETDDQIEPSASKSSTQESTSSTIIETPSSTTSATSTSTPEMPIQTKEIAKPEVNSAIEQTANSIPDKPEKVKKVSIPNHKAFDALLSKYVSASGNVDYKGLKASEAKLDGYLKGLESLKPSSSWGNEEQLAFWINAYNAYTIKLILNNYPVKSITDLHGGKPWDHKWINLDGKKLSLNNIENDIIRPVFKDPRIHFAVNCAAKSCPTLLNKAFTAGNLERQLESQTKKFINNTAFNSLGKKSITISKIFDWYGKDFGDIGAFVSRYADQTVKPDAKVNFNEYDWALNGK